MRKEYTPLGICPTEETFTGGKEQNIATCTVYRNMWLQKARLNYFGKPCSACFDIKEVDGHFEVCVVYDADSEAEVSFAYSCSGDRFTNWDDASIRALTYWENNPKEIVRLKSYGLPKVRRK